MSKKILYIMFSNPCGSPQLGNSSGILADRGWKVVFLGTGSLGTNEFRFPEHPNIQLHLWKFRPSGWKQKLQFFLFSLRTIWWVLTWRPDYVHASDPYSTPFGYLAAILTGVPVIYQEHDSPNIRHHPSAFNRFCYWTRSKLAGKARLNLLPNKDRAKVFQAGTKTQKDIDILWNVPRRKEAEIVPTKNDEWIVVYHGSIVPARLPESLIRSLAHTDPRVVLWLVGYETVGSKGYVKKLMETAQACSIGDRVKYLGSFSYHELMPICRKARLGVSFMPAETTDVNELYMVGASIKAFDYMACEVPLLVADLPDWKETYVQPGYAFECDPKSEESIAKALNTVFADLDQLTAIGRKCRQKILDEWNYENLMDEIFARRKIA